MDHETMSMIHDIGRDRKIDPDNLICVLDDLQKQLAGISSAISSSNEYFFSEQAIEVLKVKAVLALLSKEVDCLPRFDDDI